jgi:hypothetical protein
MVKNKNKQALREEQQKTNNTKENLLFHKLNIESEQKSSLKTKRTLPFSLASQSKRQKVLFFRRDKRNLVSDEDLYEWLIEFG